MSNSILNLDLDKNVYDNIPITQEFGWQISDVTNAIGVMFFTLACLAPFSGALMLNLGVTPVVLIALGLDIIGFDLTEVSPPYDVRDMTCYLANLILFEMVALLIANTKSVEVTSNQK